LTAMEIDLSGNSLNDFTEQIFKGLVQDEKAFSSKFIQSLPGIFNNILYISLVYYANNRHNDNSKTN
jgi:hypothetical protein